LESVFIYNKLLVRILTGIKLTRSARQTHTKERRSGQDRRTTARPVIQTFCSGGKREWIRRREDGNRIFWADRYSQSLFGAIIIILFFSVIDAMLTLFLIGHDATEINPVMAYYLDVGPYAFLTVKYLLTSVAVVMLLLCQNFFLRTIRIYARSLFYLIVAAFMAVVAWELFLILNVVT
jgi:hypothetical protein